MSPKQRAQLIKQLIEQRKWIEKCGGDRAGYRENYGVKDETFKVIPGSDEPVPAWSGNGGDAIYEADLDELRRIEARLR